MFNFICRVRSGKNSLFMITKCVFFNTSQVIVQVTVQQLPGQQMSVNMSSSSDGTEVSSAQLSSGQSPYLPTKYTSIHEMCARYLFGSELCCFCTYIFRIFYLSLQNLYEPGHYSLEVKASVLHFWPTTQTYNMQGVASHCHKFLQLL